MSGIPNTILIADDHPLFRSALKQTIAALYPDSKVLEAADIPAVQRHLGEIEQLDLVLLDLHMPGAHGFSALAFITGHHGACPVIMVSANGHPETIRRALDYGAAGFLSKSAPVDLMQSTIARVMSGEIVAPDVVNQASRGADIGSLDVSDAVASLTPQQFRVASMLVEGLLNKQIAYELDVTEATIKAHMTEIFKKLGVHSRTQAVLALNSLALESPAELVAAPPPL
jgi:DNA-binding NarL/FixJ family response regulator